MVSPSGPPVLSTPATHVFENQPEALGAHSRSLLSDEQVYITYEIERTISKIKNGMYSRVALQFPDEMLPDAPRVFDALSQGLKPTSSSVDNGHVRCAGSDHPTEGLRESVYGLDLSSQERLAVRLYILADTSYGACCVDEIAAEHINADAVIHYGRACLSPTVRLPVLHIFTRQSLAEQPRLIKYFGDLYQNHQQKIILMADVTYQYHLRGIMTVLRRANFCNLHLAEVVHDPSSPLPNRTVPDEVKADPSRLKEWQLFHISDPPESLLLILASRVGSIHIYPTSETDHGNSQEPFVASAHRALKRRYALLTSVNTVSIFGILINTLSVKNYLHIVERVKTQIQAAGKKSYTFVVGKINAAKVANFSEIGAWVVIGCWESSLIDSKDFWKPVLTPFELELALMRDDERVWTGEWRSDFQTILDEPIESSVQRQNQVQKGLTDEPNSIDEDCDTVFQSAAPEFDLRTGRYVSNSRPMKPSTSLTNQSSASNRPLPKTLIKVARDELAVVAEKFSPGAEHHRSKRSWKGLGSDFEIAYEDSGTQVEEGRRGIAKGYIHGTASETTI